MYLIIGIAIGLAIIVPLVVLKGLMQMRNGEANATYEDVDRKIGVTPADQWKAGRVQEPVDRID
jgi:hypothetical protein